MPAKSTPDNPAAGPNPGLPESPRSVLVADDEHLLARNLANDLAELGYTIVGPARNGYVAIELAKTNRPDIVLMDIRMPELDGLEAAKVIFEELGIPVVILSAFSDPAYLRAGVKIGVFGYLLKPVTLDELRVSLTLAWSRFLTHNNLTTEVDALKLKLEQRKVIERAKGLLMRTLNITEEEAMRALQKQARDVRKPMADLAKSILDADELHQAVERNKKKN
jgi:AmiR/NasT family two-component response regulator